MNLCNDQHDEIVYEGRNCPLCAALDYNKELDETVADLKNKLEAAESDLNNTEADLAALKSDFRAIAREMAEANRELAKDVIE